jgi:predicted aldo/keto reductase-like oxidoreductase
MTPVSRRDFLGQSALAVGAAAVAAAAGRAADAPAANRPTGPGSIVTLGRSGVKTSLLGIGTGSVGVRRSSNQVKLGQEKFTKLLGHAYERGIRYIDAADQYGSHIFIREAIKTLKLPREKLFLQTKTRAQTADVAKADIDRFLEELGTPYIDSLLMHCMTRQSWPTDLRPVMDVLSAAKDKGTVKAVGVSCHGLAPLQSTVDVDWVDIDLARINPVGGRDGVMDAATEIVVPCLQTMHQKGKGILGMKILGEGRFKTAEQQRKSLSFVLGLGCVDAFVIGFEKPEQIDEICAMIEEILGSKRT